MICEIRYAFTPSVQIYELLSLESVSPILTVWPTYDGYCKDDFEELSRGEGFDDGVDQAWSTIMASTLSDICSAAQLHVANLEYFQPSRYFWQRPKARIWRRATLSHQQIDEDSLGTREHMGHDFLLHLLSSQPLPELCPEGPDLGVLKERLTAALTFGIEEAVMHSWWPAPDLFLERLDCWAEKNGHRMLESARPFVSHWETVGKIRIDYSARGAADQGGAGDPTRGSRPFDRENDPSHSK